MDQQILNYGGFVVLLSLLIVSLFKPLWALYLIPFAMSLSPEIVVSQTAKREITLRIEDLLLVVLLLRIGFDVILSKTFPLERLRENRFLLPMSLYSLVLVFATSTGVAMLRVSPASGFFFVAKLIQFFMFFFVFVYYVQDAKTIRTIFRGAIVTLAIVTVLGLAQLPGGERVSMPFEGVSSEPNTFGGYFLLLGSLLAGLYIHEPKGRQKTIYAALLAAMALPFIYTLSRASWIAAGLTLVVFLLLTKGLQRKVAIMIVTLLILMALPLMPGPVKERFQFWKAEEGFEGTQSIGGAKFDPSTSERIERYKAMPALFVRSPLIGYGITGQGFIDGQYIRIVVETGMLGVLTFAFLIYSILSHLYHVYRKSADMFSRGMALGLFCATSGLLIHSLGGNTFMIVRVMEPYMMFLALLVSHNRITAEEKMTASTVSDRKYTYPYSLTGSFDNRVGGATLRL